MSTNRTRTKTKIQIDLNKPETWPSWLSKFFYAQERYGNGQYFKEGETYEHYVKGKKIEFEFKQNLLRYKQNKKSPNESRKYGYRIIDFKSTLGKGGFGSVFKAGGKLVHGTDKNHEDTMLLIQPEDEKSDFNLRILNLDLATTTPRQLKTYSQHKTPLLIRDIKAQEVYLYGRKKDNHWGFTQLESKPFRKFDFVNNQVLTLSTLDPEIQDAIISKKAHLHRTKAIKLIEEKMDQKIPLDKWMKKITKEANIGRELNIHSTKKPTFFRDQYGKQIQNIGVVTTDFIPGESLHELVLHSVEDILNVIKNLLFALQQFHEKGYIHRDIKPENILINPITFEVQLIDFGLSRKKDKPKSTVDGSTLFLPPEMLADPITSEIPGDVFSLGKTLKFSLRDEQTIKEAGFMHKAERENNSQRKKELMEPVYTMMANRIAEYEGNKKPDDVSLKHKALDNSWLVKQDLEELIFNMTHSDPRKRITLTDAIEDLYQIQYLYEAQKNTLSLDDKLNNVAECLGDIRSTHSTKTNTFSKDILQTHFSNLDPALTLRYYQEIFSIIKNNKNKLYTNAGFIEREYTNTQLHHMSIIKGAYCDFINSLDFSSMPPETLMALRKQIEFDQDKNKNPENLNNFNRNSINRLFGTKTDTHIITEYLLDEIKEALKQGTRYKKPI